MKEKLLQTARLYIGTPFQLHGRLKGVGCDCLGLIICITKELGLNDRNGALIASHDRMDYSIHVNGELLLDKLDNLFEATQVIEVGNLVVLSYDGNSQHLGIIGDYPDGFSLIHAYLPLRKVVEHRLDAEHTARIKKMYRLIMY